MKSSNRYFILFSPFLILALTQLTAIVGRGLLGNFVYMPIILFYWVALALILLKFGLKNSRRWFGKPQGHWIWYVAGALIGISSLPLFFQHMGVLRQVPVLAPTIVFFLINPWLEEMYWRGLLLQITNAWPWWASSLYSTVLFTAFHSAFAWQSHATRNAPFYIAVFVLGGIMVLISKRTKSLWICVFSHMLINFFNMSIPTIMNIIEF